MGRGTAPELHKLLAPVRVVGVHRPRHRAHVVVRVPLRLGRRAVHIRRRRLAGLEEHALAEVDAVDGSEDRPGDAERWLRYGN